MKTTIGNYLKKVPYILIIKLIEIIYKINSSEIRKICDILLRRIEHGESWSIVMRKLYKQVHKIEVGIGTYGALDFNKFPSGTRIGNYCSIASGVKFINVNHPLHFASIHPMFYNSSHGFVHNDVRCRSELVLGNDVWIGQGVTILPKCCVIGNGAVIGAGSIVTKNVTPYSIVAGVPAKEIGKRFSKEVIDLLEKSEWFNLDPKSLGGYSAYVNDPEFFARMIIKNYNK